MTRPQLRACFSLCILVMIGCGGTSPTGTNSAAAGDGSSASRSDGGDASDAGDGGGSAPGISVSPLVASVALNGSQTFTCTTAGTMGCSWSVEESAGGSITAGGVYKAPGTGGTYHVVATSIAESSLTAKATVNVVAPCTRLSGQVGVWQNISPPAFTTPANMQTSTVVVNPQNGMVYSSASNSTNGPNCPSGQTCPMKATGIYASSDCGATWSQLSDTTAGTPAANLLTGVVWAMQPDAVDPQTLYVAQGYGTDAGIYKSTNGGVAWTLLDPDPAHAVANDPPFVQAIAIDPYDHTHLAVTFHDGCGPSGGPYTWCFSKSTDAGATWTTFPGPVSIMGWMVTTSGWIEASSITILGPTHYLIVSPDSVWYTADTGANWTQVVTEIDYGSYSGDTYIGPDGTLYIGDSSGPIFTSAPAPGHTPPFALYQAPSLPKTTLAFQTGLTPAVTELMGSPQAEQIISDGVNLYGSGGATGGPFTTNTPFYTAPLSDPTKWTQMDGNICVSGACQGSSEMAYDSVNHIIYSANSSAGLWRLVTR